MDLIRSSAMEEIYQLECSLLMYFTRKVIHKGHEYTVRVQVPKAQQRHLWDTILMIWRCNLDDDLKINVMIGGRGAHLLLRNYEQILREYDYLKPYLNEADSSKPYEPIEEPKKRTSDQELTILKTEDESKVSDLKDRKSDEKDRRDLIARLDRSLPRSRSK